MEQYNNKFRKKKINMSNERKLSPWDIEMKKGNIIVLYANQIRVKSSFTAKSLSLTITYGDTSVSYSAPLLHLLLYVFRSISYLFAHV